MTGRRLLFGAVGLIALALISGALFVRGGVYNIAATVQHTAPVFWLLQEAKQWSIRRRAADIVPPDLNDAAGLRTGQMLYHQYCVQCHGAPGIARSDLAKGMTPIPPNLVHTAQERSSAEIFWAVKYGIKMTGMPGWDYRMPDTDIWAIVAFVEHLPDIVPSEHRRWATEAGLTPHRPPDDGTGPTSRGEPPEADPVRGKIAIRQYACTACHSVPGIVEADVRVGPPLRGIGSRKYIAGVLTNTPDNMVRWLQNPVEVDPLTAMPDLGVTAAHARDMAAYLRTLK